MAFQTPLYPGINLDDNYGPQLNAVGIAFICISAVTVILRVISRSYSDFGFARDDWLLFTAAVFSWAYTAVVIYEADHNFYGQHIGKSDPYHLEEYLKGLYSLAIVYPVALVASKLSLLSLYWRIFHVPRAKRPIQIAALLNIGWMIAAIFVGLFSCRPVRGFWDTNVESQCIQEYDFFLANEAFTMALDLVVLVLPVWFIAHIQRSRSQRISISLTFLLGLVATVISAIRLWQLVVAQERPGEDPTFNQTGAALWAMVEVNSWVVVATIPTLRLLVAQSLSKWRKSRGHPGSSADDQSRSTPTSLRALLGLRSTRKGSTGSGTDATLVPGTELSHKVSSNLVHVEANVPPVPSFPDLSLEQAMDTAADHPGYSARSIRVERDVFVERS